MSNVINFTDAKKERLNRMAEKAIESDRTDRDSVRAELALQAWANALDECLSSPTLGIDCSLEAMQKWNRENTPDDAA